MMYLIFKNDGSIKTKKLNEFIQQGNNYENIFFVAIEGKQPTAYNLVGNFILPNERTQEVISLSEPGQEEIEGKTYNGRYLSISSALTLLSGTLQVNISAISRTDDKVLVSSRVYLTINKGSAPTDPVVMTRAEYENLVSIIGKNVLLSETILKVNSYSDIDPISDYDAGQIFLILDGEEKYNNHMVLVQVNNDKTDTNLLFDFTYVDLKLVHSVELINTKSPYNNILQIRLKNENGGLIAQQFIEIPVATTSNAGLMSAGDKATFNNIPNIYETKSDANAHKNNKNNPHEVTKAQVGLGNVENKSAETIKTEFTGAIASGNTGFVKGEEVYTVLNKTVLTGASISISGDTATITHNKVNIQSGVTSSEQDIFPLADSTKAGLMSPATVTAIQQMRSEIDVLEGNSIRLLYTTKSNPTAAEILAFVVAEGYTDPSKYNGISVVVQATNHIWKWVDNEEEFVDFGLDGTNQFTNETAGIIKGSEEDGQVYAEDDGTGSVVGWSALKTRVTNLETNAFNPEIGRGLEVVTDETTGTETLKTTTNVPLKDAENSFLKCLNLPGNGLYSQYSNQNSFRWQSSTATTSTPGDLCVKFNPDSRYIYGTLYYLEFYLGSNNAAATNFVYQGSLIPRADNTYDLGRVTSQYSFAWRDLYLKGKLKDGTNEVTIAEINSGLTSINTFAKSLSMDSSTYVLTLKDANGNTLSSVDLPLETMVVSGSYDSTNKKIVLTLKNGQTIDVPVSDLVNGLASTTYVDNKDYLKTQTTGGATSIQLKEWVGTQNQFDSITTKDSNTRYTIIEDDPTGFEVNLSFKTSGSRMIMPQYLAGLINFDEDNFDFSTADENKDLKVVISEDYSIDPTLTFYKGLSNPLSNVEKIRFTTPSDQFSMDASIIYYKVNGNNAQAEVKQASGQYGTYYYFDINITENCNLEIELPRQD